MGDAVSLRDQVPERTRDHIVEYITKYIFNLILQQYEGQLDTPTIYQIDVSAMTAATRTVRFGVKSCHVCEILPLVGPVSPVT